MPADSDSPPRSAPANSTWFSQQATAEAWQDPSGQHFEGWKTLFDATAEGTNDAAKNVHAMADSILKLSAFADFIKEETLAAAAA